MLIAFDAGNTEIAVGLFEGERIAHHWRLSTAPDRTADEVGLLVRALLRDAGVDRNVRNAAIGSVVPRLTEVLGDVCRRYLDVQPAIVDAAADLPVRIEIDEPLTVGADRIANTIAAKHLYARDTIVVDFGTATTFDCITGDGAFVGGLISPGIRTGADTLVRRTAKLPRVDLEPPATVIGHSTESAMRSGIFFATVEGVDGIVRRIIDEWQREQQPLVVATGGLAPVITPHCRSVQQVEPFLTLTGLRLAHEHLSKAR